MTVHLVGAGPGDPELLTMRAARLLAGADAIVADRLVSPAILELVNAGTEFYDVGKTPSRPGPSQQEINHLLVALGRRLDLVVRLKGGDPFVFGRGAEEAAACHAAGVAVEVVPGISSAISAPALAGISVTKRNVASGVAIVTAHQDPASDPLDWGALAASGTTIVVLMGARRAAGIRDRLLAAGMSPDTPVAVVTDASRVAQSVWDGALESLGEQPVPSPSVIVIGAVSGAGDRTILGALRDRHPAWR